MADSNPVKPGVQTSEFKAVLTVLGVVVAVLTGVAGTLAQLHDVLPNAGWIALAVTIVGSILGLAQAASKFIQGRTDIKVEQIASKSAAASAPIPTPTIAATPHDPHTSATVVAKLP